MLDCGGCPSGTSCGGGGLLGVCGNLTQCTYTFPDAGCCPSTCAQGGANCGMAADGCGSLMPCGTCAPPWTCDAAFNGVCAPPDAGGDACVPATCADLEATCGILIDGCGGLLDCGVCPPGLTCGHVTPNQCGE
jgi:hypothetical protein